MLNKDCGFPQLSEGRRPQKNSPRSTRRLTDANSVSEGNLFNCCGENNNSFLVHKLN